MADKDAVISVSASGSISVNPENVTVKKNQDQVKWSCSNSDLTSLSVAFKDGSYSISLTKKNGGTWEGKSKQFTAEGTFPYNVIAVLNGKTYELDPAVIVDP